MPKWASRKAKSEGPRGWHLYPACSVTETGTRTRSGGDIVPDGKATGIAYCGLYGREENVTPLLGATRYDTIEEYAEDTNSNVCDECSELVRAGRLTDPAWHDEFMETARSVEELRDRGGKTHA